MDAAQRDPVARLRLLEIWLPLAQAENERHGWGCNSHDLEQLILAAAAGLQRAPNLLAAQAILWHYYHQRPKRYV